MKKSFIFIGLIIIVVILFSFCSTGHFFGSKDKAESEIVNEENAIEAEDDASSGDLGEKSSADSVGVASEDDLKKFLIEGYKLGELPKIELFDMPDFQTYSDEEVTKYQSMRDKFASLKGVFVFPALVDANGLVYDIDKYVMADDAADNTKGTYEIAQGLIEADGIKARIERDGSGLYMDENKGISILRKPDGTGEYKYGDKKITILGGEAAVYSHPDFELYIKDKDNAVYDSVDLKIKVENGKAVITTREGEEHVVDALPMPEISMLPKFPSLEKLKLSNVSGARIALSDSILFDFDSYEIKEEGKEELNAIVEVLNELGINKIEIHGHTDSMGEDGYNMTLSESRANSLKDYMKTKGLNADVKTKGFGGNCPVDANTNSDGSDSSSGRRANRRVEIYIPAN